MGEVLLAVFKAVAGIMGGSHALIADALHSIADIIFAFITLVALNISRKDPDREHPYGYGKVEFIAATIIALGLLITVVFISKDAIHEIKTNTAVKPSAITFFVAIISILTNEILYRLNKCAGVKANSPALLANAKLNRYDSITSGVVALGILLALAGFTSLDPIAAMFVGVVIIKVSIDIFREAYVGLMDANISKEQKTSIEKAIKGLKGVSTICSINGRRVGQRFWINMTVKIHPSLTIAQGYKISEKIRESIFLELENIEDIHVEIIST